MLGRLLTLCIVSPLFIGVSYVLLNIFLNMVDQIYAQFLVFKGNDYDFNAFLDLKFEVSYLYVMNMDYWIIYAVVGAYLIWQGVVAPFYDITKRILKQKGIDTRSKGVEVNIEETADKPKGDIPVPTPVRSNEPTQIQVVPVPMLTSEQLQALNKLAVSDKQEEKVATEKSSEEKPENSETTDKFATKPNKFETPTKPKNKFEEVKKPKNKFEEPSKPPAFKRNRNLEAPQEEGLGKVYMNVPSEIRGLGKKEGE